MQSFLQRRSVQVVFVSACAVLALCYYVLSDVSLLTSVFAANLVPTPAEARGSVTDEDGIPFMPTLNTSNDAGSDSLIANGTVKNLVDNSDATGNVPHATQSGTQGTDAMHAAQRDVVLTAVARKRVWVRIITDNGTRGRVQKDYFLRKGRMYSWRARQAFVISVGFRGGAEFAVGGQRLSQLDVRTAPVKNIGLTKKVNRTLLGYTHVIKPIR